MIASNHSDGNPNPQRGLGPVEYSPLAEQVFANLREAILSGEIAPGARLVETAIAEEMHVSRGPVREALNRLEAEGMVEIRPRRGAFVAQLTKQDVWEIYTLRAALEGLAFRLAGESCSEEDVAHLQAIVKAMGRCAAEADVPGLSALDIQFHESIVELAGHRRLLAEWMSIIAQIQLLSRRVINTMYPDLSVVSRRHQKLLDTLVVGSAEQRTQVIEEHIMSIAERRLAYLGDEP